VTKKMLVVAAHMGDFIWRCGGSIAKYSELGDEVHIVVLSYGSRGESKDYWEKGGGTIEECNRVRREEGEKAAQILGATSITFCEYEDYPMSIDKEGIENLATIFRKVRPDFILTHDKEDDVFNPDHNLTRQSVMTAYQTASGAGYIDGYEVSPRQTPIFGFEPHNTEICNFKPKVYIDISDVMDKKIEAMRVCQSQKGMCDQYIRKAEIRASQCATRGGKSCAYSEAFSNFTPISEFGYFVW